ncbi:MAG: glycosyltransferase family A protein [Ginsengibacter sp.]
MKFSVIIPTHNRVNYLHRAIESILNQTYQTFEIIVVNDYPEDRNDINNLLSKFNNIRIIHNEFTGGGNMARNLGVLNAEGDIIAFLDDDDVWLPDKLALHFDAHMQYPEAGLVFSDCLYKYDDVFIKNHSTSYMLPEDIVKAMGEAKFCPATTSMVTIRRECIKKCGIFDEALFSFQDWDYWFRIAHYYKFNYIPKVLVHYTQHLGERTSQNEDKRVKGLNQICKKWNKEINLKIFRKPLIINIYYRNSLNELMADETASALKKSFKLLSPEVISIKSFKTFIGLVLKLFRRRAYKLLKWSITEESTSI